MLRYSCPQHIITQSPVTPPLVTQYVRGMPVDLCVPGSGPGDTARPGAAWPTATDPSLELPAADGADVGRRPDHSSR